MHAPALGCGTCRAGGTDVRWFCCFFLFWTGAFLWRCEGVESALGTWLNGGKPLQVAFHALVIHKSRLLVWCINSKGHRGRSFLPTGAGCLLSTGLWRKQRKHKVQETSTQKRFSGASPDAFVVSTVDFILQPVCFYSVCKNRPAPLLQSDVVPMEPTYPLLLYIH